MNSVAKDASELTERRLVEAAGCGVAMLEREAGYWLEEFKRQIAADPSLLEALTPMTLTQHCANVGINLPTEMESRSRYVGGRDAG